MTNRHLYSNVAAYQSNNTLSVPHNITRPLALLLPHDTYTTQSMWASNNQLIWGGNSTSAAPMSQTTSTSLVNVSPRCEIHPNSANTFWPDHLDNMPDVTRIADQLSNGFGKILGQFANVIKAMDILYQNHRELTTVAQSKMQYYEPFVTKKGLSKIVQMTDSIKVGPQINMLTNSTVIDFGAAPGAVTQRYLVNSQQTKNKVVPITIQSRMTRDLENRDRAKYMEILKKHSSGIFAPEKRPDLFPTYDGNIFCRGCIGPVTEYIKHHPEIFPPLGLCISDIGSAIKYNEKQMSMDYLEIVWIVQNIVYDIEMSYNDRGMVYRPPKASVIVKIQRFAYQLLNDPLAFLKLALIIDHAYKTNHEVIITKPYPSAMFNDEMYIMIVPVETIRTHSTWYRHIAGHSIAKLIAYTERCLRNMLAVRQMIIMEVLAELSSPLNLDQILLQRVNVARRDKTHDQNTMPSALNGGNNDAKSTCANAYDISYWSPICDDVSTDCSSVDE